MNKPNTLLKVVSVIYIVASAIAIVLTVVGSIFAGSLIGMLFDSAGLEGAAGAGVLTGGVVLVVAVIGSVFTLIAGILGVKCRVGGCRVFGIILLVFAVIQCVWSLYIAENFLSALIPALIPVVLPALYTWGAFKQPKA